MSDSDYMDTTPVREPPEGQVSNLVDPVSRAYQLEIVIGLMTALVTISIFLRIYCRLKIAPVFGADDCRLMAPRIPQCASANFPGLCLIATVSYDVSCRRLMASNSYIRCGSNLLSDYMISSDLHPVVFRIGTYM